jgi:hypothetical protein
MSLALADVVEAASGQISVAVATTVGSTAGSVVDQEKKGPGCCSEVSIATFLPCSLDI